MSDEISKVVRKKPCKRCANMLYVSATYTCRDSDCFYYLPCAAEVEAAAKPEGGATEAGDALRESAKLYEEGSCARSGLTTAALLCDTLARQLAEANERAEFQQAITKELLPYQDRAVNAEAQLAEANRRLAEVADVLRDKAAEVRASGMRFGLNSLHEAADTLIEARKTALQQKEKQD